MRNAELLLRRPDVFLGRRGYILVLSHMRSYSSLLCHILGSHHEIAGYAEMHQSYTGPLDLLRLRARVTRSLDGQLHGRFVLDKILHNEYEVATSILGRRGVHPIFLVRDPLASVSSIVEMGRRVPNAVNYSHPAFSAEYYARRLHELARLAEQAQRRPLFVKAEDILGSTGPTLESLGRFLRLGRPLEASYSIFKHTGEAGWGDDSPKIRAGRILRARRDDAERVLDRHSFSRATEAYAECCEVLERRCDIVRDVSEPHTEKPH